NGTIRPNYMMEVAPKLQELVPDINVAPFVNWIIEIPERLDDPLIKPQIEQFLTMGLNAKKGMGICSLSESNEIDEMWEKYYAGYDTGYCIEYDVSSYSLNNAILPVIYDDDRKTNIIMQIVNTFICQLIADFSYGQIETDKTQYIRLFLTKNKKWGYQREWRLIGEVGEKPHAPKIKTIYLGKKVSGENKKKMLEYCHKNGITMVER
ncbi:MAG TPA: DUF2971 domain-containing protein, partial [Candidatus Pelethenecus sp.]|nr:DUF2971 domain-containing protein [Candidatus Pelethenecus sp.]